MHRKMEVLDMGLEVLPYHGAAQCTHFLSHWPGRQVGSPTQKRPFRELLTVMRPSPVFPTCRGYVACVRTPHRRRRRPYS